MKTRRWMWLWVLGVLCLLGEGGRGFAVVVESFPPLVPEGEPLTQAVLSHVSPSHRLRAVAFHPGGALLASAGGDQTVRLWEVSSGREVRRFDGHRAAVRAVAFDPGGALLASAGWDGTVRLWEVSSGREVRRFDGHTDEVGAVVFRPGGGALVFGSNDGTMRTYTTDTYRLVQISLSGQRGLWATCQPTEGRCWRYDDGTLLQHLDTTHTLTPVLPPPPAMPGELELMHAPPTLLANDGEAAPFSLTLRNRGQGRVYWVNVVQDPASSATAPIILFPPPTTVIVEPGATIELPCWVAAPARRVNPQGRDSTLALQITTAHGEPLHLSIPVQARAPSLQMVTALQTADAGTLEVAFRNDSAQDIASETVFQARLGTHALDAMTRQHIGAHEPFTLAFAIPAASLPLTRATPLSLTATKLAHPVRVWEFPNQPITLPRPAWYLYVTLVALVMGSGTGVYYLRLYRHPLVAQLSTTPQTLLDLAIEQLPQAHHLLHRTGRLATVLAVNALPPAWLDQAGQFLHSMDATARATCLAQRLHSTAAPLRQEPLPLFTMPMSPDFALNVDQCLLAFPPATMPAAEVLTHLQQMEDTRYHPCLLISTATLQQAELRQASHDPSTWLVTPSSRELTALLLSPAPLEVCARLIASQVQVRRISPYQTGGGVNKEGLFFGRTQLLADIMQRGPANYLLVGGRQMGKSSLLKALERRYQNDPQVRCHYLVLSGADVRSHLARALDLSFDTPLDTLAAYLRQPQAGQRWLFLLDEADAFVDADIRQGAPTLQLFRSLSEAGHCHFMLAGFWSLYHSATLDYQSPIRNFGTTLVIGALEADACRDLATQPMHLLNLHYADDTLVPTLVQATGQRANLIAIVCNEMGQQLSAQDRTISPAVLQQALDSQAVRRSLAGWERLTEDDEPGNRLDRIIVYSAINHDAFTLDELRTWFDAQQYAYAPEHLNEALARLELAYILARRGQAYHFCVPLFVTMVQAQNPPRLLADELRMERGRSQP